MSEAALDWDKIEEKTIVPGYRAKFIYSANMTFALWSVDAGAELPAHTYPHEQVMHMLEGTFEFTVDGKKETLTPGNVMTAAPEATRSGKALTTCRMLNVFYAENEETLAEAG